MAQLSHSSNLALRRAARWIGQMADLSSPPRCVTGGPRRERRVG